MFHMQTHAHLWEAHAVWAGNYGATIAPSPCFFPSSPLLVDFLSRPLSVTGSAVPLAAMRLFSMVTLVSCVRATTSRMHLRIAPVWSGEPLLLSPSGGPDTGGTRLVLRGDGLPASKAAAKAAGWEVRLGAGGELLCDDLRVEVPWRQISCTAPRCVHCSKVAVALWVRGAPLLGTPSLNFAYSASCFTGGARALLPPRNSPAETCTVCRLAVGAALANLGDTATHADVRTALRRACDSQHFRSSGRAGELYCREDLSGACTALYRADAPALAEAIWQAWAGSYELGALPAAACAAIGRCPPPHWFATHTHEEAWDGLDEGVSPTDVRSGNAPALLLPVTQPS